MMLLEQCPHLLAYKEQISIIVIRYNGQLTIRTLLFLLFNTKFSVFLQCKEYFIQLLLFVFTESTFLSVTLGTHTVLVLTQLKAVIL